MFHELREYHLKFAASPLFLEHYENLSLPVLEECGFDLVAAWLQDVGPDTASTFVWLVRWDDLNARTEALDRLRVHPGWSAIGAATKDLIRHVDTRILRNVSFSPPVKAARAAAAATTRGA
jgi:hypothetical protein